jgi:hypothetical protein
LGTASRYARHLWLAEVATTTGLVVLIVALARTAAPAPPVLPGGIRTLPLRRRISSFRTTRR